MKSVSRIVVTFTSRGVEVDVTYTSAEGDVVETPGSKRRVMGAATMAATGLRHALEHLDKGAPVWGGYGTNLRTSTDRLLIDSTSKGPKARRRSA